MSEPNWKSLGCAASPVIRSDDSHGAGHLSGQHAVSFMMDKAARKAVASHGSPTPSVVFPHHVRVMVVFQILSSASPHGISTKPSAAAPRMSRWVRRVWDCTMPLGPATLGHSVTRLLGCPASPRYGRSGRLRASPRHLWSRQTTYQCVQVFRL